MGEPESRLASILRSPPVPRVREEALGWAYLVSRSDGSRAVVVRRSADGEEVELARSDLRRKVNWPALASSILGDALDGRVSRKLASDYSRFIVTARDARLTVTGRELQAWLDTWRPPLSALLREGR